MFQELSVYLQLGFDHILDWQGYDHMLFILALCTGYTLKQWRAVLILITAFTIGHSLTLALSALDIFRLNEELVERLIPLTILLTALFNLFIQKDGEKSRTTSRWAYLLALGFGLIHGMGFSSYFRALMMETESIIKPLLGFNLGLEVGQILFVILALGLASLVVDVGGLSRKKWNISVSVLVAIVSLWLLLK